MYQYERYDELMALDVDTASETELLAIRDDLRLYCSCTDCCDCVHNCENDECELLAVRFDLENIGGEDLLNCHFCNEFFHWGGHRDDPPGTIWSCEECGYNFCSDCFVEQIDAERYYQMVLHEDAILCPVCYKKNRIAKLESAIEAQDWSVSKDEQGWELSKSSPAGEDFSFFIHLDADAQANPQIIIDKIDEYHNGFDSEEHAAMWVDNRNVTSGVPDIRTLIDDAGAIKEMLAELLTELRQANTPKEDTMS